MTKEDGRQPQRVLANLHSRILAKSEHIRAILATLALQGRRRCLMRMQVHVFGIAVELSVKDHRVHNVGHLVHLEAHDLAGLVLLGGGDDVEECWMLTGNVFTAEMVSHDLTKDDGEANLMFEFKKD